MKIKNVKYMFTEKPLHGPYMLCYDTERRCGVLLTPDQFMKSPYDTLIWLCNQDDKSCEGGTCGVVRKDGKIIGVGYNPVYDLSYFKEEPDAVGEEHKILCSIFSYENWLKYNEEMDAITDGVKEYSLRQTMSAIIPKGE